MGLSVRLQALGSWGVPDPRGYTFSFAGFEAWQRARRASLTKNTRCLATDDNDKAAPVILNFGLEYDDAVNTASEWNFNGLDSYITQYKDAFAHRGYALGYERSQPLGETYYFNHNTAILGENEPFSISLYLFKPPAMEWPFVGVYFGDSWMLEIVRGRFTLQKCKTSTTWNITDENTLHALMQNENITAGQQEDIDELRSTLYEYETAIDISDERAWGNPLEFVFIPEPCGVLNMIEVGSGKTLARITDTAIADTRRDGVMWKDTPVTVATNGPAFQWAVGKPRFAATGEIRLPRYPTITSGSWTYTLNKSVYVDESDTAITSVAMSNVVLSDYYDQIKVTLSTTDPHKTPFFYAGHAYRAPGDRDGDNTIVFDTDSLETNPVMEGTPRYEESYRRVAIDLILRNIEGDTILGSQGDFYHALENRRINLWINGTKFISKGICQASGHDTMRTIDPAADFEDAFAPDATITPLISDMWAVADEALMISILPVGDGLYLGRYLRDCLQLIGVTNTELAGIGTTEGRVLPTARPGEDWLVQPPPDTTVGEWLRELMDRYGEGYDLWVDEDGVWQFAVRSTTPVYSFTSAAGAGQVFRGMVKSYDTSEFYNAFRVEGAARPDGTPIVSTYIVQESVYEPTSPLYIGRIKWYPTLRDENIKTQAEANRVVRSLKKRYCTSFAFVNFQSFFKEIVRPGDRIEVNDVPLVVSRINGGSLAFGSSTNTDFAGQLFYSARLIHE